MSKRTEVSNGVAKINRGPFSLLMEFGVVPVFNPKCDENA